MPSSGWGGTKTCDIVPVEEVDEEDEDEVDDTDGDFVISFRRNKSNFFPIFLPQVKTVNENEKKLN